jgi:DNA polymerase (family 10)
LPDLITADRIRGTFHLHTVMSDGAVTLEQYLEAARARGWGFMGIADHSVSAFYAGGLSADDVARQAEAIAAVNDAQDEVRFFRGIESDIKPDGSLDYPDDVLAGFDFVVASVHSHFTLKRDDMTRRLVRAVSHPATRMLGHLTGRLLLARPGYDFDLTAVLEALAEHDVALELNANPHRLDADRETLQRAVEMGVKITINPDAHHVEGLDDMDYGVHAARRAWLTADQVINTWDFRRLLAWLKRGG